MIGYEKAIKTWKPELCIVVGDVTSTMACAIVAKKEWVKVAHVEGGISTNERPKQFLDILGVGKSLIRMTFERAMKLVPADHVFIVTNKKYKALVMEHLPELPQENILCEPSMNNTAPCIAYTALRINALDPNAVFAVLPSDHVILKEEEYVSKLSQAFDFATSHEAIVTLGIQPTRPDTGYGYINYQKETIGNEQIHKVISFKEKPDLATAETYLESGDYLWNADAKDIIVISNNHKQIVIKGLKDYIVVDEENALLIYPKSDEQEIKGVVQKLLYDKGIREFVESARQIKAIRQDVEFWVVGELDAENPATIDKDDLVRWVDEDVVYYHGFIKDVRSIIAQSDCIVLPSYREGLPRIVIEGMSMAKPVITTLTAGCAETVDEGINGYLVNIKDIKGLTTAFNEFLSLTHDRQVEMGLAGRAKAINEFDDKRIALEIFNLVE
ncbi:unnamed protein product, partial [Darwinula stevensoni]